MRTDVGRSRTGRILAGVLGATLVLTSPPAGAGPALPDWDAAKSKQPSALPDWDAAAKKKPAGEAKKEPTALPDWEAEKARQKPAAPAKKKAAKKPGKPEAAPDPAAPAEPATTAEPVAPAEPVEEPTAATEPVPTAEPTAAQPEPVAEAPEPAPAVPVAPGPRDRTALRRARAEMITGGALLGVGLGGLGAMTAGVLLKRSAEAGVADMQAGADDELRRAESVLAIGAVAGVMGVVMGAALLGEGARDRKIARAQQVARVRVAPTLGGLMIRGRF